MTLMFGILSCVGEVVTMFIEAALAFKGPFVDRKDRLHRR